MQYILQRILLRWPELQKISLFLIFEIVGLKQFQVNSEDANWTIFGNGLVYWNMTQ